MTEIDHTHAPTAVSWVSSAQREGSDFPIQNLPFGVFKKEGEGPKIGIAIGDYVLDLQRAFDHKMLSRVSALREVCRATWLNPLMSMGRRAALELRHAVFGLLTAGSPAKAYADTILRTVSDDELCMPVEIGDFTDFFTSIHHARRTGEMFRPDAPLHPNFQHLPVAYHGRASSVVQSGIRCRRPNGQIGANGGRSMYVPTEKLDYELEVGFYIGQGNDLGSTLTLDEAETRIFGLCLVNDWSARDMQRWESLPLGPFLSKGFMTTVSPWIITLDALAPFRVPVREREAMEPTLPSLLSSHDHGRRGGIDIALSISMQTLRMQAEGHEPVDISHPQFAEQYWSIFQMLAHHASNGCNLRTGDLLSSGTVSGPERSDSGCLLELTKNGDSPLTLPNGEVRRYLEDGDLVRFRGQCRREGFRTIGFGPCEARVKPASPLGNRQLLTTEGGASVAKAEERTSGVNR